MILLDLLLLIRSKTKKSKWHFTISVFGNFVSLQEDVRKEQKVRKERKKERKKKCLKTESYQRSICYIYGQFYVIINK